MDMKIFLLVSAAVFGLMAATPQKTLYASAPAERGAYYVRGRTTYNYGYNTGDGIAKVEARHPDGTVTGSYRYFDPLGRQIIRSYIADDKGFRVLGNALPVGPEVPALGVLPDETIYGTAEGTNDASATNHYTSTFLLRNHQGDASNQVTSVISQPSERKQYDSGHIQRQNELIRQQEELIRRHEEQLSQLKSKRQQLQHQRNDQRETHDISRTQNRESETGTSFTPGGYYSSVNPLKGIYFYHQNKRNYDFPAGFSYGVPGHSHRSTSNNLLYFTNDNADTIAFRPLYKRRN